MFREFRIFHWIAFGLTGLLFYALFYVMVTQYPNYTHTNESWPCDGSVSVNYRELFPNDDERFSMHFFAFRIQFNGCFHCNTFFQLLSLGPEAQNCSSKTTVASKRIWIPIKAAVWCRLLESNLMPFHFIKAVFVIVPINLRCIFISSSSNFVQCKQIVWMKKVEHEKFSVLIERSIRLFQIEWLLHLSCLDLGMNSFSHT